MRLPIPPRPRGRLQYKAHVSRRGSLRKASWKLSSYDDIDGCRVETGFDVRGVIFLDHLDRCPAILGDLVDVGPFHQTQADVGVTQAVSGARLSLAVGFEFFFVKDGIEQFTLPLREQKVRRFGQARLFVGRSPARLVDPQRPGAALQPLERPDGAGHAFAIADAALAPHLDFKDCFSGGVVIDDGHIAELQPPGLVRPEAGIHGEQHVVVELLAFPFEAVLFRLVRALARRLVELLVFFGRKPRPVRNLGGGSVRLRQVGEPVQPAVAHSRLERLAQRHDLLMHGVMRGRFSEFLVRFLVPVNAVLLYGSRCDFGEAHLPEKRNKVIARPPVLALDVVLVSLALRDDVVFLQILFGGFAVGLFGLDLSIAELAPQLEVPVLGDFLGFGEALFLRRAASIFPGEIGGALPVAAVRALVDVDLAAEDVELFWHGAGLHEIGQKGRKCERHV